MKRLVQLFWVFFCISISVVGGGYVIISVADRLVTRKGWFKEGELFEMLPVFQMTPGLIATHTAVCVGRRVAGGWGALVAVTAAILPSILIFLAVSLAYDRLPVENAHVGAAFCGVRAAETGIIAAALWRSWPRMVRGPFAYVLLALAFGALALGVETQFVLLAAMLVGVLAEFSPRPSGGPKRMFRSSWFALLLFFEYGLLGFGGGFVLLPMYLEDFVGPAAPYLQLATDEFSNVIALTQITPGPIGINGATYFGFRLAGVPGAVLASLALILPGTLLIYLILRSLERFQSSRLVKGVMGGVRPASAALMAVVLIAFLKVSVVTDEGRFDLFALALVVLSTLLAASRRVNVILVIVVGAALALLRGW